MHDRIFFPLAGLICLALGLGATIPLYTQTKPKAVTARTVGETLVFDSSALNRIYGSKETPIMRGPRPGGQIGVRMVSRTARNEGGRVATLVLAPETARQVAGRRLKVTLNGRMIRDYGSKYLGVSFGGGTYALAPAFGSNFTTVTLVVDAPENVTSLRFWPDVTGGDRGVEIRAVGVKVLS